MFSETNRRLLGSRFDTPVRLDLLSSINRACWQAPEGRVHSVRRRHRHARHRALCSIDLELRFCSPQSAKPCGSAEWLRLSKGRASRVIQVPAESLKIIADAAQVNTTWALALLGGSIAVSAGTSYVSPKIRRWRLMYLLFVPGWIGLAISIYYGNSIIRRHVASRIVDEAYLFEILRLMNSEYGDQQWWLIFAVVFFSAWLIIYMLWWTFVNGP